MLIKKYEIMKNDSRVYMWKQYLLSCCRLKLKVGMLTCVVLLLHSINVGAVSYEDRISDEKFIAQQDKFSVSGIVKDENGDPIPGVSVVLDGTTVGTVTGMSGEYQLSLPQKNGVLVFSFIGMETQKIELGTVTIINIQMESSAFDLQEVAVVAYGTKKKVTITGAVSSVGTEELTKMPSPSVNNMLAGSVSGLSSVQVSGQPGEDAAQLFIRGVSTLTSSSPLVLVDGVERGMSQIDPNEIADITVLKDASSTAVFGVRGANGVILVTTRRGKEGKPKISFSSTFSLQAPTRLGKYANAKDYMTYMNEADVNDGRDPSFSQEILDIYDNPNRNKLIYPDTDWQALLYDDVAPQHQHNVNISGGSKRVRYFASFGMLNQKGIFNGNDGLDYDGNFSYKRNNLRANLDIDVTKTTLLSVNIGGRIEKRNEPQGYGDNFFKTIREANPLSPGLVDGKNILPNNFYTVVPRSGMDFYNRGVDNRTTNVLNLDFKLKQDLDFITDGLDISLKGSYNSNYWYEKTRTMSRPSYMPWIRKDVPWLPEPETEEEGNQVILIKDGDYGEVDYDTDSGKGRDFYVEAALNYKRSFGVHNVSGLLMYNQSRLYYPYNKYYNVNYVDLPEGYVGLVTRATYDYKSKYLLDINMGYNGSEKFHRKQRYGLFPSASAGWVVSEENFFGDSNVFSFIKLRASYGIVGADNIERFLYLPDSYAFGGGYNFGGVSNGNWVDGAYEGSINNKDVTWETAHKQNYGIDMRMFDARFSLGVDVFKEKRDDILIRRNTYPIFVAYTPPAVNQGRVDNEGFEFNLKWSEKVKNFRYTIGLLGSYAKNTVVYKDEVPNPDNPWTLATGHPLGQPFGYKFLGFYQEGMLNNQEKDAKISQPAIQEGDCVYADLNGDDVIDKNDKTAIGYPNYPAWSGGLNIDLEYKKWSFTMNWSGATHVSRVLEDVLTMPLGSTGDRSLMQNQFDNRWTPETAETATLPRATISGVAANSKASSLWIKDASYVRLRNIRLQYSIEGAWMDKIGMKSMKVYAIGYNLLTFDKLGVLDPEIRTQGKPTYPIMKMYSLGVNLSF
jgi:TonB-linked SusC/RagA family outer membrane protein